MNMSTITLAESYKAANLVSCIQRLLSLDGLWTNYLSSVNSVPSDDYEILEDLTAEMEMLLRTCSQELHWLRALVRAKESHAQQAWAKALEQYPQLSAKTRRILKRASRQYCSLGSQAASSQLGRATIKAGTSEPHAVEILSETALSAMTGAAEASTTIRAKMLKICEGRFVKGDLPKEVWCGAVLGLALAAAVGGQWWAVAGAVLGADRGGCFGEDDPDPEPGDGTGGDPTGGAEGSGGGG